MINGFKTSKEGTLSQLEKDIILYSTEKYFPLTKCFKEEKLTKEIIQNNLIVKYYYLKQAVDKYKANKEKLEYISRQLDLIKLNLIISTLEPSETRVQSIL